MWSEIVNLYSVWLFPIKNRNCLCCGEILKTTLKCAKKHGNWFRYFEDISRRCEPSNVVARFLTHPVVDSKIAYERLGPNWNKLCKQFRRQIETRSTQRAQTSADPEDPDFGLWNPGSEAWSGSPPKLYHLVLEPCPTHTKNFVKIRSQVCE